MSPFVPARSPEAIHPHLPFVRPAPPPGAPSTSCTNDITVSPDRSPSARLETVTRKKLTDRTRSFSFCGRGQMNSFETSLGERYSLVFSLSFFLKKKKEKEKSREPIWNFAKSQRHDSVSRVQSAEHNNAKLAEMDIEYL